MEKTENPNNQIKPYEQALCQQWGGGGGLRGGRQNRDTLWKKRQRLIITNDC